MRLPYPGLPVAETEKAFKSKIRADLNCKGAGQQWSLGEVLSKRASAVLFLLAIDQSRRLCLVLSKRSDRVRQAGDLCCPGGSVNPVGDCLLSIGTLAIAGFSNCQGALGQQEKSGTAGFVAGKAAYWIMVATALREAWEEIRLNPFNVEILGPLPPQPLVMYEQIIFPVVGWMKKTSRLRPNWEVAKMLYLPFEILLNPTSYARFRFAGRNMSKKTFSMDFPCVVVETKAGREILWGATYRICMNFLGLVFRFKPPAMDELAYVEDIVPGYLDENQKTTVIGGNLPEAL